MVRAVRRWAVVAVIAGLFALALVWGGWRISGGGLFWVGSPSMGVVAPVGSLVATQPLGADQPLHVGEIVVFRPRPQFPDPFVHRIYRVLPGPEYLTKGDLNPGPDPWTITRGQILGTPSVIIPAIGWIYKLSVWLCAGAAMLVVSSRLARGRVRHWIVIVGPVVLIAPPIFWYRFLVNSYVYGSSRAGRTLTVRLVNTGVFPARFAVANGLPVYSAPGQEVTLRGALPAHQTRLPSTVAVALPWWGWALVAMVLLSPLVLRRIAVGERSAATGETGSGACRTVLEPLEQRSSENPPQSLSRVASFQGSRADRARLSGETGNVAEMLLSRSENNAY